MGKPSWTFNALTIKRHYKDDVPLGYPATITHTPGATTTLNISVAEHLNFAHSITASTDLRGKTVRFAPSMWAAQQTKASVWWEFVIPSTAGVGDIVNGTLSCPQQSVKNIGATMEILLVGASTGFSINLDFYVGMETYGYDTCKVLSNHTRFLKNATINPAELNNDDYGDVYHNDGISISNGIYYFAVEAIDQFGNSIVPYKEILDGTVYVKGKWYSKNYNNATPDITAPDWKLYDSTGLVLVDNLSLVSNTIVKITANFNAQTPLAAGNSVYVIKTNSYNDFTTFINNYKAEESNVPNFYNAQIISGIDWTLASGTTYRLQFTIDHNELEAGGLYRIIVIAYGTGGVFNSFISSEYTVTEIPTCTEITLTKEFVDLGGAVSQYAETSVQDRLIGRMVVGSTNTNTWLADLASKLSLTPVITPTQVKVEIYTEETLSPSSSVLKQVYETETATFKGWVWNPMLGYFYADFGGQNQGAKGAGFIDMKDMFYSTDGTTLTEWNECQYLFRLRYEDNITNVATFIDGVQQPIATSSQNWAGRILRFKMYVTMQISFTAAGVPYTYYDVHVGSLKLSVRDFENNQMSPLLFNTAVKDIAGNAIDNICVLDQIKVSAEKDGSLPNGSLIALIDQQTYSIKNIKEHEAWFPDTAFTQLMDASLLPDIDWSPGTGTTAVNLAELDAGEKYRVTLIYKIT